MLVATDVDTDDNSSLDSSTDNRDTELQVLGNPTVWRSVRIQRNAQILSDAPRPGRFEIVPPSLTEEQRREYVRYEEDDKGNLIWVGQIRTAIPFISLVLCYLSFSDILQVATGFRMLFGSFSDVLQAGQAYGCSYRPQGTCKGFGEV
jgi:hypothetical protein